MELFVITGISGAGKSSVLNVVEDLGYYTMDNVPPQLVSKFVELYKATGERVSKVAVVLDIRTGEFFKDILTELDKIEALGVDYKILFLDASDSVIIKRYKEFRRPHPLALDGNILEGLAKEREILEALKKKSNYIIDTSRLTIHKLRAEVLSILQDGKDSKMQISIVSFGFKNGILLDADFVFDLRFLPNPHYVDELKPQTGMDEPVKDFVFGHPEAVEYLHKIAEMIRFVAPKYMEDGKVQMTVGIGCTGGKHRSVAMAEELKKLLELDNLRIVVDHRDTRVIK